MSIEMLDTEDTALTVQSRAALALNSTQTEVDLQALATKNAHIVAVVDKAGRQQAHGAAMELKTARSTITNTAKAAREDATAFQGAVIAEEKRLVALIQPEEKRLLGLRDAWDDEQERIRREEESKERARVTGLHERINVIRGYVALAGQCRTAERIAGLLKTLGDVDLTTFQEFTDEAAKVHSQTLQAVTQLHTNKVAEEVEAARAKEEQEAAAAKLASEQAALAAERASLEREREELTQARAAVQKTIEDAKPKLEPVDEFAEQVAQFAQATSQPVVVTGALHMSADLASKVGTSATAVYVEEDEQPSRVTTSTQPTDMQIVEVLSLHYRVHESKVLKWLQAMDLDAVTEAIAAEFH